MEPAAGTQAFESFVSERLKASATPLSQRWLERLLAIVPAGPGDVFPTDEVLDHIPLLLAEIAAYLEAPEREAIIANTSVAEKARELGRLRRQQRASLHQVLREFELLVEILQNFVEDLIAVDASAVPASVAVPITRRLTRAVLTLMEVTVQTFVSDYTDTIEEQKNRLERFNLMAAHELRTPLGAILTAADLLQNDGYAENAVKRRAAVEKIRRGAVRLSMLIDRSQRLAAGRPLDHASAQSLDLERFTREVARQLREMADRRGVRIEVDVEGVSLETEPGLLEQVLLNLVSNAIKYADPAKVERYVRIAAARPEDSRVAVRVEDNGLGIPTESQHLIFRRFTRLHTHLDDALDNDGDGLGLAIVKECLDELGGTITLRSTPGLGTAFVMDLPADRKTGA